MKKKDCYITSLVVAKNYAILRIKLVIAQLTSDFASLEIYVKTFWL